MKDTTPMRVMALVGAYTFGLMVGKVLLRLFGG
jgi:hypothetical protein